MPTQQNQSCIETGNTGWISIHINDSQTPIDLSSSYNKDPQHEAPLLSPVIFHLFEHQREIQAPFPGALSAAHPFGNRHRFARFCPRGGVRLFTAQGITGHEMGIN